MGELLIHGGPSSCPTIQYAILTPGYEMRLQTGICDLLLIDRRWAPLITAMPLQTPPAPKNPMLAALDLQFQL